MSKETNKNYEEKYQALLQEITKVRPELFSLREEAYKLRKRCSLLAEKNSLLEQELDKNFPSDSVPKLEREIEHLREKVIEMSNLVQDKDKTIEDVFKSKTFRIGSIITNTAKKVTGG